MDNKEKRKVINHLRKLSRMWPAKNDAKRNGKVGYGKYKCKYCGIVDGPNELQVDHINPVVPITGWDDWNGYIDRLFCPAEDMQVLCKPCHQVKSKEENALRRANTKKKE